MTKCDLCKKYKAGYKIKHYLHNKQSMIKTITNKIESGHNSENITQLCIYCYHAQQTSGN